MKKATDPRIFIVEDNLFYQQLIAKELESISRDIYFFTKGESCVDALILYPAVIVLDYDLEGCMTGLDTLKSIRDFDPSIYTVLFSDRCGLDTPENFDRYGIFDFVEKAETTFSSLRAKITNSCFPDKHV